MEYGSYVRGRRRERASWVERRDGPRVLLPRAKRYCTAWILLEAGKEYIKLTFAIRLKIRLALHFLLHSISCEFYTVPRIMFIVIIFRRRVTPKVHKNTILSFLEANPLLISSLLILLLSSCCLASNQHDITRKAETR